VRATRCLVAQLLVGQIGYRFGGRSEEGWWLHPAHGKDQGKTNELLAICAREHDPELGDIIGVDPYPIETVSNVDFGQMYRPQARIGIQDWL
jgi:hypothetical protein